MRPECISGSEARRIALAAQGFAEPPPDALARRHLQRVFDRVGLIQVDSVNVITRSHYLPPFARLGSYDKRLLDAAAWGPKKKRFLFEYWGHEASLILLPMQPLFRWRMAEAEADVGVWGGIKKFRAENSGFVDAVLKEIDRRGPIGAGALEVGSKGKGAWWGWSDGKRALEWLFWSGKVTTSSRKGFERLYDLPERVLPPEIFNAPTPTPTDAQRELIRTAARAMGVATETDLRDYFRMGVEVTKARIAELVEAGELQRVDVKGWDKPAWLSPGARRPRKVRAQALLSPFDSLVWRRDRVERIFDFRYRIEIYVPAHAREHGYYVLPFLMDDKIVARLDLKSDRPGKRLLVKTAHLQPGTHSGEVAERLKPELELMSAWLGLDNVFVEAREPLGEALRETPSATAFSQAYTPPAAASSPRVVSVGAGSSHTIRP